jgi:hypothetical protein
MVFNNERWNVHAIDVIWEVLLTMPKQNMTFMTKTKYV